MTVYKGILDVIGKTPLVELCALKQKYLLMANIFAKIESFNPGGSVKDRTAYSLIMGLQQDERYLKAVKNNEKITIVEATSGNTGIALAMICARLGYSLIICMPANASRERVLLLKAYGAEVILTDTALGMKGAIDKSLEFTEAFSLSQFKNPYNPLIHEKITGKQILEDLEGRLDIFVAGVGTGGTITGCARYFKEQNAEVHIVAVEPFESQVLKGSIPGRHGISGIGAGFIPDVLDMSLINEIIPVKTEDAYIWTKNLARDEGILCGVSSGAALAGAIEIAKKHENKGKNIAVILPDTGERYLSTPLFE
ncbi:MAG: cysteine synthase A [Clostridia bacterium]|nr:cysteine synthase A [Clostridia bacterium]NLV33292.1 cysteine synthase A [Clostridiaceae bacterium]OQB52439.1 MAG: O-acetylserine sulfhydrylase [Firmicutes bacterium ADurb.Bin146]MDD4501805.1 cysteine synthase A [Clostridia bacterium]HPB17932.1 cysteine synthase A [Clostridia bacterium]